MRSLCVAAMTSGSRLDEDDPVALTAIIRGGTVYDGSGGQGRIVDVGIEGDRVVALAENLPDAFDAEVLDATGLVVVPGFINVLSHGWGPMQSDGSAASDLLQGVTTEVFGEAFSLGPSNADLARAVKQFDPSDIRVDFDRLGEGLDYLEHRGIAPNVASFVGGHNLRILAAGFENRLLTSSELDHLTHLVAEEMQDGALGIGTALIYPPGRFATTDELVALCEPVGRHCGTYISHLRSEGDQLLECMEELLEIGRRAGCRVEVYHLKASGRDNWSKMASAIELISTARDCQPVGANMYPYTAGFTALSAAIPPQHLVDGPEGLASRLADPAVRAEIAADLLAPSSDFENLYLAAGGGTGIQLAADLPDGTRAAGRFLSEVAAAMGCDRDVDALLDIVQQGGQVGALYHVIDESNIELGLSQPWVSIGSDALAHRAEPPFSDAPVHPRTYGTFSRVLGHYTRDRGVLTFPEAIRRMTRLPAEELGLAGRGAIEAGSFADIVVLDPVTVADRATYEQSHQYAVGTRHVLVNGQAVVRDGRLLEARPGRRLRRQ